MVGLVKAYELFDPHRGTSWSSFACSCIINEVCVFLRSAKSKRRKTWVSLDSVINEDSEGNLLRFSDILVVEEEGYDYFERASYYEEVIRRLRERLTDAEAYVFKLVTENPKIVQAEIAKLLGCSQ